MCQSPDCEVTVSTSQIVINQDAADQELELRDSDAYKLGCALADRDLCLDFIRRLAANPSQAQVRAIEFLELFS